MFGLFRRKRQPSEKEEMVREFYELLDAHSRMSQDDQMKIALALQMLWQALNAEFGSPEAFGTADRNDQMAYLEKLLDFEQTAAGQSQYQMEFAVTLLKMTLAPVIEGDDDLFRQLAAEIEPINRLGWELNQVMRESEPSES